MKFLGGEGFDPVSSMTNNVHDSVEGGRYPFDSDKKNNGLALLEDSSSRLMGQRSPTMGGSLLSLSQQSSTTTVPNLARFYHFPPYISSSDIGCIWRVSSFIYRL